MSKNQYNSKSFDQLKKKKFTTRIADAYRNTSLLEKVAGSGAILFFITVIIANSGNNPLIAIIAGLSLFALFNLFVYATRVLLASIIILLHVASLPYIATLYSQLVTDYTGDMISPLLVLMAYTLFFSIIAYRICRGRYWLTLLYLYIAMDIGGAYASILLGLPWGTATALIASVIVVTLRAIPWRRVFSKKKVIISTRLADGSQDGLTNTLLEASGNDVFKLDNHWPLSHVRIVGGNIELIATMTPKKALIVNKNRFYYDGEFIEPLLKEIVEQAGEWSLKHKIPASHLSVIALIHDVTKFPTNDSWLSIGINEKGSRHSAGRLAITTPDGLVKAQGFYDNKELPEKIYAKVVKASNGQLFGKNFIQPATDVIEEAETIEKEK